jgi:hypothetical protein
MSKGCPDSKHIKRHVQHNAYKKAPFYEIKAAFHICHHAFASGSCNYTFAKPRKEAMYLEARDNRSLACRCNPLLCRSNRAALKGRDGGAPETLPATLVPPVCVCIRVDMHILPTDMRVHVCAYALTCMLL